MELLYNPESMPEQEIKDTFVGREWLIGEIVNLIEHQPVGPGLQHVVIIGPRGMGKTTMLLMLRFAIKESGLISGWQPVKFHEESYGINDLADFWIEALSLLAADTEDTSLAKRLEQLKSENPGDGSLAEAALATIKDWCRISKKRLLLLVDNIDMILDQINDELDFARLRDVLMNDGSIMIVGTSVSFFKQVRAYDQPLYNFFKPYDLAGLKLDQTQDLLRKRADMDGLTEFSGKLEGHKGRLKALDFFTGGNPRLVLMLYGVLALSDVSEVRTALEKLLDEITPFYKAKVESLPAQQRKILDQIARTSGKTNEGLTPAQIAVDTRLPANQVSAQLKRLSDLGYVGAANIRGRSSYYALSEPLYALWHQMRFGRDAHERMKWLVDFLRMWLEPAEMAVESMRLKDTFHSHLASGMLRQACDVLEHRSYLAEAMGHSRGHSAASPDAELGAKAAMAGNYREALERYERVIELSPDDYEGWLGCGWQSLRLVRADEAITCADRALQLAPQEMMGIALMLRGLALLVLGRDSEAQRAFNEVLDERSMSSSARSHGSVAIALMGLGRYQDALDNCDKALSLEPDIEGFLYIRAISLRGLGRHAEAISAFKAFLRGRRDSGLALEGLMMALACAGQMEEAPAVFTELLNAVPDDSAIQFWRGVSLYEFGKSEEALLDFDRSIRSEPHRERSWLYRGAALAKLGRLDEAIESYQRAIDLNPEMIEARVLRVNGLLTRFVGSAVALGPKAPTGDWEDALRCTEDLPQEGKYNGVAWALISVARSGQWQFARDLINGSHLEERLFPLVRTLDCLLSADDSLIEKLSPEVRRIVDQLVTDLRAQPRREGTSPTSGAIEAMPHRYGRARGKTGRRKPSSTDRQKRLA